jgi:predicted kinase
MHTSVTRFVVVAGPPCSGKSTVARRLSDVLPAPHLEMDRFRERLLPHGDQRVEDRDLAYHAMHYAAELLAPWSETIVLDATYTAAVCRRGLVEVVQQCGGAMLVIECVVSVAAAVERYHQRGLHPALDLTAERVAALARDYPYFAGAERIAGDGSARDIDRLAQRVSGEGLDEARRAAWWQGGHPRELTSAVPAATSWHAGQE